MNDLYQKSKLQPSLLDRLTDESLQNTGILRESRCLVKNTLLEYGAVGLLPSAIVSFICDLWQQVLLQQVVEQGVNSMRYQQQLKILEDIIALGAVAVRAPSELLKDTVENLTNSIKEQLYDSLLKPSERETLSENLCASLLQVTQLASSECQTVEQYLARDRKPSTALYDHSSKHQRCRLDAGKLKELVRRDLAWLLNTTSLDCVQNLDSFPFAKNSVLNYGVPNLTGVTVSNLDVGLLQRQIKTIILNYEPRIIKKSLQLAVKKRDTMSLNSLLFDIECDIWGQPHPEHMLINSEIDLETGAFKISESPGSA